MNKEDKTKIISAVAIIAIIVAIISITIALTGFSLSGGSITERGISENENDNDKNSSDNGGILPSLTKANVILRSYGHDETFRLLGGFVSQVTFTVTNKGSADAEEIRIHPIVYDGEGNVEYDFETSVASTLRPEESTTHTIRVNYNYFSDDRLKMDVTVMWEEGQNAYEESYEPEVFSGRGLGLFRRN